VADQKEASLVLAATLSMQCETAWYIPWHVHFEIVNIELELINNTNLLLTEIDKLSTDRIKAYPELNLQTIKAYPKLG